ncbi:triose-phosphate isomerase [Bifidobacterium sp. SMB2]|uniref:Triosephosphate isomerase n=1 Tax=Bifidobacterium saimiriisciurei TaxID=2661627 RepID=A0ABX0CGY3_9BIFI|nr:MULTISPECIES: triose-phosphate isomerase [Bifidobacterium]NEG95630.1 triose-phosphate isomerase [Bifidobacterium sp. SMB2]NEH11943.1 triose-phosphate isomerase [Bifidobacterium saimiriisciurei]
MKYNDTVKRRPMVIGNWKMNLDHVQARQWLLEYASSNTAWQHRMEDADVVVNHVEIGVLPSFTSLLAIRDMARDTTLDPELFFGAQNVSELDAGAYTGDISAQMLAALGCRYVLLGHSEQRRYHPEDDDKIDRKMRVVLDRGMTPIVCIGETKLGREDGIGIDYALNQLVSAVRLLSGEDMSRVIVAYEPVWSIGTGMTPDPSVIESALADIRDFINATFGADVAAKVRILYGGSVNPGNAAEIIRRYGVDGFLVGGASLDPAKFAEICHLAAEASVVRLRRSAHTIYRPGKRTVEEFTDSTLEAPHRMTATKVAQNHPDAMAWRAALALAAYRTVGFQWLEEQAAIELEDAADASGNTYVGFDADVLRDMIWANRLRIIESMMKLIDERRIRGMFSIRQWLIECDDSLSADRRGELLAEEFATVACMRAYHEMNTGLEFEQFRKPFVAGYLLSDVDTKNRLWRVRGIDRKLHSPWKNGRGGL